MISLPLIITNESVINTTSFFTMPYNCNYTALTVVMLIK